MKTLKRIISLTAAAAMAIGVFCAGSVETEAAASVRRAVYDEHGEVEVDFAGYVQYRNPAVTVKDQSGKSYTAVITDIDDDEMEFRIRNYKSGMKYTFTISGVRRTGEATFGNVYGSVTIPGGGWMKEGEKWYFFRSDGKKATGWVQYKGDWYFLNSAGQMQTGWLEYNNKWYYLDKDGEMETGWEKIGGKWYYFDRFGVMLENTTHKIGTKTYRFNRGGACANP